MSFNLSTVKWVWVVIGAIVAAVVYFVVNLVVQFGYGLVIGFQLRGAPPQDMLVAAFMTLPFLIGYVIIAAIAALIGSRMAAKRAEENHQLTGLVTGILAAVFVLALRIWQWSLDIWVLPNVVMAVLGGWLGGWLVSKSKAKEMD